MAEISLINNACTVGILISTPYSQSHKETIQFVNKKENVYMYAVGVLILLLPRMI
jgi:hypothetical protein